MWLDSETAEQPVILHLKGQQAVDFLHIQQTELIVGSGFTLTIKSVLTFHFSFLSYIISRLPPDPFEC